MLLLVTLWVFSPDWRLLLILFETESETKVEV